MNLSLAQLISKFTRSHPTKIAPDVRWTFGQLAWTNKLVQVLFVIQTGDWCNKKNH